MSKAGIDSIETKLSHTRTNMDGVCHKMGPGDEKEQIVKEHHEIDTDTGKIYISICIIL